jgi:hypothetical protein
MSMDVVTEENVEKMKKEHQDKIEELHRVNSTTIQQMWLHELELLEKEYNKYKDEREKINSGSTPFKTTSTTQTKKKVVVKK